MGFLLLIPSVSGFSTVAPLRSTSVTTAFRNHEVQILESSHHQRLTSQPAENVSCEVVKPPEPLATPGPLTLKARSKVSVSFVIGNDGQVHSPVILQSAGTTEDESVLEIMRTWRYRPASCNSVPTESEVKVEFSSR